MRCVDERIASALSSKVPLVGNVAQYIVSAGGKRIRPALVLLTCGALNCDSPARYDLAAVVEFIHTATLLHDDVVDDSSLRRGRPTANQAFGNAASVLVGDFLYSRAFQMMVQVSDMRVMQVLADATNIIAEGEVWQMMHIRDASLSDASYLNVIRAKTAKLFEASSRLGAILAQRPDLEQACAEYGQALGTAYQIIDDILDYDGSVSELGKNQGNDLREGKVTLPLILAMRHAPADQSKLIADAVRSGGGDHLNDVLEIVKSSGALDEARRCADEQAQRAIDAARLLPQNPCSDSMVQLAMQLLLRRN
jgi:octaprenyl-diphosphate synthase